MPAYTHGHGHDFTLYITQFHILFTHAHTLYIAYYID